MSAYSGRTGEIIRAFVTFPRAVTGVRLAVGDVNGDGYADIAAAPAGVGFGGFVAVYDGRTAGSEPTRGLVAAFHRTPGYRGQIDLAVGDVTGAGWRRYSSRRGGRGVGTAVRAYDPFAQFLNPLAPPVRGCFLPSPAQGSW